MSVSPRLIPVGRFSAGILKTTTARHRIYSLKTFPRKTNFLFLVDERGEEWSLTNPAIYYSSSPFFSPGYSFKNEILAILFFLPSLVVKRFEVEYVYTQNMPGFSFSLSLSREGRKSSCRSHSIPFAPSLMQDGDENYAKYSRHEQSRLAAPLRSGQSK